DTGGGKDSHSIVRSRPHLPCSAIRKATKFVRDPDLKDPYWWFEDLAETKKECFRARKKYLKALSLGSADLKEQIQAFGHQNTYSSNTGGQAKRLVQNSGREGSGCLVPRLPDGNRASKGIGAATCFT
ncbi:hypothetical protein HHI36_001598, partial [Cryptolaemus montrouzieri]